MLALCHFIMMSIMLIDSTIIVGNNLDSAKGSIINKLLENQEFRLLENQEFSLRFIFLKVKQIIKQKYDLSLSAPNLCDQKQALRIQLNIHIFNLLRKNYSQKIPQKSTKIILNNVKAHNCDKAGELSLRNPFVYFQKPSKIKLLQLNILFNIQSSDKSFLFINFELSQCFKLQINFIKYFN
ncbi:hypothetical protein pb186bvf_000847 [Paramecium bursaria]